MRRISCLLLLATLASLLALPLLWAKATKALQIYFIDVEGGQATLVVSPLGGSMLIDTGWPDENGRDANRIMAAAKAAGRGDRATPVALMRIANLAQRLVREARASSTPGTIGAV